MRGSNKLSALIQILQTPASKRAQHEISHVVNLIKDLKFFKERNISDDVLHEITNVIKFEKFEPGQVIMNFGERGDKFYVIVQGLALVRIPNPQIKSWRQKHFFMKENETQLQKLLDGFLKKFDSLPVIKNTSIVINSAEDLSRLSEN